MAALTVTGLFQIKSNDDGTPNLNGERWKPVTPYDFLSSQGETLFKP